MQEITSVQNPIIKEVHSLQQKKKRNKLGLFLIEGYKGVSEALKSNVKIKNIFVDKNFNKDVFDFPEEKAYKVTESILKKISTTESPPEVVAVAYQKRYSADALFIYENPLILIIENIKDPGNLGAIIRTAVACNASGIILTDETVDIYNPKTVRSSAANLWKIPLVYMPEKGKIKETLNKFKTCQFIATTVSPDKKSELYYNIDYKKPVVLIFGSEAEGLSEELLNQADSLVTIPMSDDVESLNLSVSVGIILYEAVRQRKY